MEPVIRCKIIRHTHVFQPGNVVEVRRRIIEKSENQPVSGYYIPDIGDGTPGIIPLDAAEPVADNAIPGDSYYGKCVLTSVSNYSKNPGEAGSSLQTGIIKPENVRIIHYAACQQLVFHMPAYAWDAGTFRLTNTCSGEVLEEKPVRDRLNGGTMILTNTLPYPPGFYTIEADWPDGWGLVRASNTTPVLVLRFDADNEQTLLRIQEVFRKQLLALDAGLKLPF